MAYTFVIALLGKTNTKKAGLILTLFSEIST